MLTAAHNPLALLPIFQTPTRLGGVATHCISCFGETILRLSDLKIRSLKAPPRQTFYRDEGLAGFGIRVTPKGAKSFAVMHGSERRLTTIGRFPIISLAEARAAAIRLLAQKTLGTYQKRSVRFPPTYAKLNDEYSRLIDIRNELNSKLGADGEKGGALMKRVFSPSDANTKELFASVKNETGIDLTNEATLARYVMDVMGDARQKSMLKQLDLLNTSPTPTGLLGKAIDYIVSHFNTPEAVLKRARTKTIGGGSAK
jgi:hypothetical protein